MCICLANLTNVLFCYLTTLSHFRQDQNLLQGESEWPFYMRNGSCKYGLNCRFNHPDPTAMGGGDTLSGHVHGGAVPLHGPSQSTMSPWSSPRGLSEPGLVPGIFQPTQGVPSPYPERNGHQVLH